MMKTKLIKVSGNNDSEKSESLRNQLTSIGHSASNYEWHGGEPLYHGNPTAGFFAKQGVYFAD